ncbi:nucleotide exchange factor GrpE [Pollutimonas thiosulfatoxidans]|uniref:Protein GrpE n=1 Tax=Pollutimonas thiosulfatoxidans TaxID=2028345 RepID=A0A410G8M1_9BURK|nr:nucleotide exchange factor GrpE [Pollutimonas thiosulfatoxidans]MBF6618474.1 nucleotide exchange factor GrpE [Candidimonas sp.]NYT43591.1 nucleotide exchange factor GrpE [Alcaligenaceae bacterium]QAA92664.1 nucleotide exchange factor GrpE [Pollutimonas thiosulfatoxidans]
MPAPNEPLDPKQMDPSIDTSEKLETNEPDDQTTSAEVPSEAQQINAEEDWATLLSESQAQVAQYHEELLRAKAEAENIRRRAQEDVAKARKFGTESFAESLIPVKDSLEAALALTDQTAESWKEGVEATLRQLNAAFDRNLLKEVAPVEGDKFDPHQHQAISSIPSERAEGEIVQVLQKGYTIADRVLRPALVMVSSGQPG